LAERRSRKRGRRERPDEAERAVTQPAAPPVAAAAPVATTTPVATAPPAAAAPPAPERQVRLRPVRGMNLYEERNAAVRATLEPLAPGERPTAVVVSVVLAALLGAGNLIAYAAGAKIGGKRPAPEGILAFSALMFAWAYGMWRLWYPAVLLFMILLAVVATFFTLFFVEASNLLGFLVPPVIIGGVGVLFYKLVRALSRIQMPKPPPSAGG
jgi:hypothetical protein